MTAGAIPDDSMVTILVTPLSPNRFAKVLPISCMSRGSI